MKEKFISKLKKLICSILAVCLVVSLLPMAAFAAGAQQWQIRVQETGLPTGTKGTVTFTSGVSDYVVGEDTDDPYYVTLDTGVTEVQFTVTPPAEYEVESVQAGAATLTPTNDVYSFTPNANTVINIAYAAAGETDIPISTVEIDLVNKVGAVVAVGDTLPQATTDTEGVSLTTAWTNEAGDSVSTAAAAGKYTATITVTAEKGYVLSGPTFTIDGETVTATTATFTLTKEITVEPEAPALYDVTVNATPAAGGTAAAEVDGKAVTQAAEGAVVIIAITANEGYEVEAVTKNGVSMDADADGVYTFSMPADDVAVEVIFKEVGSVNATVEAETAVNGDTASASVDNSTVTAAIEQAKKDADVGDGTEVAVNTVTISAKTNTTGVTSSQVTLDQAAVATLAEAKETVIETDVGTVSLPQEVLADNSTKPLTLVVDKKETSSAPESAQVKASFDVTLESNGTEVGVKNLTDPITLKFNIGASVSGKPTMAYWDPIAKLIKKIASSVYDSTSGIITGKITHLTEIVVVEEDQISDIEEPEQPGAMTAAITAKLDENLGAYVVSVTPDKDGYITFQMKDSSGKAITYFVNVPVKAGEAFTFTAEGDIQIFVWGSTGKVTFNQYGAPAAEGLTRLLAQTAINRLPSAT